MRLQAVRGFKDWLPKDLRNYHYLCETSRKVLSLYGFEEVKIPILEKTELFVRSIGETTDIVQKETYTFQDRNGDFLTLRPEATAGICRMVIEQGLYAKQKPLRLFTMGPMFRHERPQKGRLRQFHQVSVEYFGEINAYVEAELILLAMHVLNEPEKKLFSRENSFVLELNSLGCPNCRPSYRSYLVTALAEKRERLCRTCQDRLKRNPLRILDCKESSCKELVADLKRISDFWCDDCWRHFSLFTELLKELSLEFVHNPYLVRGLDYYVRTVFEIKASGLGAQDTVCAGGRYDHLVEELGGPKLPGFGFAIGLERWALAVFKEDERVGPTPPHVFVAPISEAAKGKALILSKRLRSEGVAVVTSFLEKSLKAQLKAADRLEAKFCLILGEDEISRSELLLKQMDSGKQERFSLSDFESLIKRIKA